MIDERDRKWDDKFDYFVRWVFGAIYANQRIRNSHITDTKYKIEGFKKYEQLEVGENDVGECNMATIILCCCAVEMYGRILLGYTPDEHVSRESFVTFMRNFFPEKYRRKEEKIYTLFRCGLVHSYVTGAKGSKKSEGFFPTRDGREDADRHLKYREKPKEKRRLILNLDIFAKDLKDAFEDYYSRLKKEEKYKTKVITGYKKNKKPKNKQNHYKWKPNKIIIDLAENAKKVLGNF